ncbi:glycoside hydrolase family 51 protein [Myriangium duriaei CBS 260.36]|uniref:non-reducing end alpha-L-arabinofuranosidase n=1 Tax=Myriangium duriaei CBS 260.36 TaxID=1168546 RepID=A0A9P4MSN7_9PEZI|nr:glycoside hydrolase family 51 protein [Myriangium duriaei CBS 260.36]
MNMHHKCCLVAVSLWTCVQGLNLSVASSGGFAVNPMFHGIMFEDINYSGDGGIYAELIQNRGFQNGTKNWAAIGDVSLFISTANGVSPALPNSLKVSVPANASGTVGIRNTGYDGIWTAQQEYQGSFYIQGHGPVGLTASLLSATSQTLGSSAINASAAKDWQQYNYTLTPSTTGNSSLAITFDAASVAGQTLNFGLVSLFPPTFNGRANGLRPDIASTLKDMAPAFLRFPGGNNIEGSAGVESRWKWNLTIGPLEDRPGRQGTWSYFNDDGLGLLEYMSWCQDLDLTPVLAVWSGLVLDGTIVAEDQLQPYIDEAMDELEFLLGDASTPYGAHRAQLGFPDPFVVNHVEIGNEDNLYSGFDSYSSYRFKNFADAILAKYPNMTVIASAPGFDIATQSHGKGWADYHQYDRPDHLVSLFTQFNNVTRDIPILVGEFAVIQENIPQGGSVNYSLPRLQYPTMIGAVAEAVYMIGAEINADVVQAMSYAPLLSREGRSQWDPNLISFNSDPSKTSRSTSYYVQQMFAQNVGQKTLPMTGAAQGPIYFNAMQKDNSVIVKLANYNGTDTSININIPGCKTNVAHYTTISAPDGLSYNSPGSEVTKLVTTQVTGSNGAFSVELADLMVGVLVVDKDEA